MGAIVKASALVYEIAWLPNWAIVGSNNYSSIKVTEFLTSSDRIFIHIQYKTNMSLSLDLLAHQQYAWFSLVLCSFEYPVFCLDFKLLVLFSASQISFNCTARNIAIYLHFPSFPQLWDDAGCWNHSMWKIRICNFCAVNTAVADNLAT